MQLEVQRIYFDKIKSGEKIVEVRLFKGVYKTIKKGELLWFITPTNSHLSYNEFYMIAENIELYDSFEDLLSKIDKSLLGFKNKTKEETLLTYKYIYKDYNLKDYKVMAIYLKKINKDELIKIDREEYKKYLYRGFSSHIFNGKDVDSIHVRFNQKHHSSYNFEKENKENFECINIYNKGYYEDIDEFLDYYEIDGYIYLYDIEYLADIKRVRFNYQVRTSLMKEFLDIFKDANYFSLDSGYFEMDLDAKPYEGVIKRRINDLEKYPILKKNYVKYIDNNKDGRITYIIKLNEETKEYLLKSYNFLNLSDYSYLENLVLYKDDLVIFNSLTHEGTYSINYEFFNL